MPEGASHPHGRARRIVDDALGVARLIDERRAGNQILVGRKTGASLSLEHLVAQDVLLRHAPVGLDL